MTQTPITIQVGNTKVGQHPSGASFALQVHGGHTTPSAGAELGSRSRQNQQGGIETTKEPKAPVTPFGTLLQKVMHAPVLPQTWIPSLGRDLGVPMLTWMHVTRGTFCFVDPHPQRIKTVAITLTKGHRDYNNQVSLIDPWVVMSFLFTIYSYPSVSFFSLRIFSTLIFLHFYWKEPNQPPTSFPLQFKLV